MRRKKNADGDFEKLRGPQPFRKLIPSLITIAGLCFGLSAIRFGMLERWELCVAFIFAAALIDGLDGRAARLLNATSNFGAQLDSLSDFVCFGVAPVLLLYMWQLEGINRFGWAVVLFYAVCCALRLARFNTAIVEEKETQPWEKKFFVGIPSPAGGLLVMLPLLIAIESDFEYLLSPWVIAAHVVLMGALMVTRIPTYAAKQVHIEAKHIVPVMLACAFSVVFLVIEPWKALILFGFGYLLSIPFSCMAHRKLSKQSEAKAEE